MCMFVRVCAIGLPGLHGRRKNGRTSRQTNITRHPTYNIHVYAPPHTYAYAIRCIRRCKLLRSDPYALIYSVLWVNEADIPTAEWRRNREATTRAHALHTRKSASESTPESGERAASMHAESERARNALRAVCFAATHIHRERATSYYSSLVSFVSCICFGLPQSLVRPTNHIELCTVFGKRAAIV